MVHNVKLAWLDFFPVGTVSKKIEDSNFFIPFWIALKPIVFLQEKTRGI